jgi:anti-anti-sigma regulatory factor
MELIIRDDAYYIVGSAHDEDAPLLKQIQNSQKQTVIIDLSECTRLCSLPIGVLVHAHGKLSKEGKTMILRNPTPAIKELMENLKLDTIIEVIC